MYKKKSIYAAKGVGAFKGAYWCVCSVRNMFPTVVHIAIQINVAPEATCAATITPRHMTLFSLDQFVTNLGLMA